MSRADVVSAFEALKAGDPARAADLLDRHLADTPADGNALNLRAVAALRMRSFASARAFAERASEVLPTQAGVWLTLGHCCEQLADWPAAEAAHEQALRYSPAHPEALAGRAEALFQLQRWPVAALHWAALAQADARHSAAFQRYLDCAALQANSAAPLPPAPMPSSRPSLSVVCCSIDTRKQQAFERDLADHFGAVELCVLNDARSLAEAYNRGIGSTHGEWLIFCHDDISFAQPDFAARFFDALRDCDLLGVAGTTRLEGPTAMWSGPPNAYCQVAYPAGDGAVRATLASIGPARIDGAQALDGLFIAVRRSVLAELRFDADTFDGFHLYDTDFSYRAARAGWRVRIAQDLLLVHESAGHFGDTWAAYAERFRHKFPDLDWRPAHPAPAVSRVIPRARLSALQQVLQDWQARAAGDAGTAR